MKQWLGALVSGVLFGAGLVLGGMLEPARIVGFLDFFGTWDPTLALVMIGALAVAVPSARLALARPTPLFADRYHLPASRRISAPLVVGSALFGVGWALAGYCPGPALTNLASGTGYAAVFAIAMTAGVLAWELVRAKMRSPSSAGAEPRSEAAVRELGA